jgi:hypothetical protein
MPAFLTRSITVKILACLLLLARKELTWSGSYQEVVEVP